MKIRSLLPVAALVAVTPFLISAPASAYTVNPDGTGFVGKGEVQTLIGLNNKAMQTAHTTVAFKYAASAIASFECEWWTGPDRNRKYHTVPVTQVTSVNATVADIDRKTGQWTGWRISGIPASIDAPEVTDEMCGAEGNEMKSVVPGSVEVGDVTGGLLAVYNGQDYPLTLS